MYEVDAIDSVAVAAAAAAAETASAKPPGADSAEAAAADGTEGPFGSPTGRVPVTSLAPLEVGFGLAVVSFRLYESRFLELKRFFEYQRLPVPPRVAVAGEVGPASHGS